MNESIFSGRRPATAILAIAALILMAAIGSPRAQAQCGPYDGDSSYTVSVASTWPVALGLVGVSVNIEDAATGTPTTYNHTNMTAGSSIRQKFNASNPTRGYNILTVTLTYCTDHVIFQVYCFEPGPVTYCAPIVCNGNSYCVKITYSDLGTINPKITINAVSGACPNDGSCTEL
jgi:hypothetical protein